MKRTVSTLLLLLACLIAAAQPWMSAPYLEINGADDAWKRWNFYEIQQAFARYAQAQEQILDAPDARMEEEVEENECDGEFEGWAQFKRWEAHMAPRVYPSGDVRVAAQTLANFQSYQQSAAYEAALPGKTASANWMPLGPTGTHWKSYFGGAGRVTFLRFHPTNPNVMWTFAPAGGLWKTTDAGQTWATNTDQLPMIGTTDMAINPRNPNIMYLAMGDGNGNGSQLWTASLGIYKSVDGGNNWSVLNPNYGLTSNRAIYKLAMNPDRPDTLFAASNIGLLRTFNGGATWTTAIGVGVFTDIEFKPGNPNIVYASSGTLATGTFYKSTDGGTTWAATAVGVPAPANVGRLEIGVTPADPNIVYLAAVKKVTLDFYGFYRSTDSGDNFTLRATTPNILQGVPSSQAHYNIAMAVSALHKDTVVVGGTDSYKSWDGGLTWTKMTSGNGLGAPFVHPDVHDLQYLPNNDSTFFSCNDGGVWKTTDYGTSWNPLNEGLQISQMYRLGTSHLDGYTILTGHQDMATHKLIGNNWSIVTPNTGDGVECLFEHDNDTIFYMETYQGRVLKTTNTIPLMSVVCSFGGAGVNATGNWMTPMVMHPAHDTVLLIGKAQVWRSLNAGSSFLQVGNLVGGAGNVVAMAYAPSNTNDIYVAKSNRIFLTTDGNNFNDITGAVLPVASASITWIAVSNTDPNRAWVTFSGFSAANKVFQTVDGGLNWTNYSTGLPNLPVNCIVYQNGSSDGLYVGTDVGVYYRDNAMAAWQPYLTNLPNVDVEELEICYLNGKLRAATNGRGLWETDLATPLPIQLSAYAVECTGGKVQVNWATASQSNNDYFTVERSDDGEAFTALERINGAGTSNQTERYSYTDADPTGALAYYRLQQTDLDGHSTYSRIVSTHCVDPQVAKVTVYPNPNNGRFTLQSTVEMAHIDIRNLLGELVYSADLSSQKVEIDLSTQAKGIYLFQVSAIGKTASAGKVIVR